jgi:hypothetical protein
MNSEAARALILKGANEGEWIKRAHTNDHITIGDRRYDEPEMLDALELLYREGYMVQVPSAGQAQTAISFKLAEHRVETGKL